MFKTLADWFGKVWNWWAWAFTELWRQSCSFIWSVWSVVLVIVGIVTAFMDWLQGLVGQVVDLVDQMVFPTLDLSCGDARFYLELANTFLPVSELFAFLIAYAALLGLLLLYKGVKSLKSWVWAS